MAKNSVLRHFFKLFFRYLRYQSCNCIRKMNSLTTIEYLKDVYPFAKKCHLVYKVKFCELFVGNSYKYMDFPCQICTTDARPRSVKDLNTIYKCRLCNIVMCDGCGEGFPEEPIETTLQIRNQKCGRYTLLDITAKNHYGDLVNNPDFVDQNCYECSRQIGYFKNGDYAISKCILCLKVFCQFCKFKHMDEKEKQILLTIEFILNNTCSYFILRRTYGKQLYAGKRESGSISCNKCSKFLGSVGKDAYDFPCWYCKNCKFSFCANCNHFAEYRTDIETYRQMYLSQAEKKNEIKALTGPKCGSEYVYLTADGKSS
jgi:hypothetical protein